MKRENFFIKNIADGQPVEIDINAEIGEDIFSMLFGDGDAGITIKSISEKFKDITPSEVILNISSPGGDLLQALAIHDFLQNIPVKKTININGFAASAATLFIDLGEVSMSDTAMILVHRCSTGNRGNANDFDKAAEDLRSWDEKIARVYQKKTSRTGTTKKMSQIYSLMEEDRWINAEEAKEFGLIDTVKKGQKIAAYAEIIEKINNSNLPKIEIQMTTEEKDKAVKEQLSMFEKLGAEIKAMFGSKPEPETKIDNSVELLTKERDEIKAKFELQATEIEALKATVTEKVNAFNDVKTKFEAFEKELNSFREIHSADPKLPVVETKNSEQKNDNRQKSEKDMTAAEIAAKAEEERAAIEARKNGKKK
jgi:ATP-dependent Clp protease protease subunit